VLQVTALNDSPAVKIANGSKAITIVQLVPGFPGAGLNAMKLHDMEKGDF